MWAHQLKEVPPSCSVFRKMCVLETCDVFNSPVDEIRRPVSAFNDSTIWLGGAAAPSGNFPVFKRTWVARAGSPAAFPRNSRRSNLLSRYCFAPAFISTNRRYFRYAARQIEIDFQLVASYPTSVRRFHQDGAQGRCSKYEELGSSDCSHFCSDCELGARSAQRSNEWE